MNFLYKTFFLLLLSALCQQSVFAQINNIQATITNKAGKPWRGNFLLTDTAGKTVRNADFNGSIAVTGLNNFSFKLTISSLFFADTTLTIHYNGNKSINLGTIIPKENINNLNQVTITSSLPLVRYGNNGNLEVNVAGTILASSSSVTEILSRTPGITITEGIISLQGKGEAIIYLNGTLVSTERLASIPTSQITKIEVIANPPARYEAAGRAVINITTKAPNGNGTSGRISQQLTNANFAGTNANTFADLGYGRDRLSLSANIALLKGRGRELLYTTRIRKDAANYLNSELTTDWNRDFKLYATYGIGAKYSFTPKSALAFSLSGNRDKLGGTVSSTNNIQTTATKNGYGSDIARDELRNNNSLILDYTALTDTLGSGFFISGQYAKYHTGYNEDIDEFGGASPRYLQNLFSQHLHISSIQADRTKNFNKTSKLETGIRFSAVGNNSATDFRSSGNKTGPYYPEAEISSNFSYKENISATYASLLTKIGKLTVNIGARAEWTNYSLRSTAGKGQNFKNDYLYLFPNLQMELPVGRQNKLRASYAARVTRPRYQALNPFVIYQDPFTTIEGNPNLLPEKAQVFDLSANLNRTEIKLAYTYTTNLLSAAALRGNTPESYVLKSINISSDQSFLLSVTRPFSIGNWWQSINTASITYAKSFDNNYEFGLGKTRPQLYFYSSNTFNIIYGIKLQLLAWYLGDRYNSLGHQKNRSNLTAGIEKSLFKNEIKIGLTANDIFNSTASVGDYNVGKTQIYYNRSFANNYFRLTASYRFGGTEKTVSTNSKLVQPENGRAN